jgi:predicted metalloenzyme YecM
MIIDNYKEFLDTLLDNISKYKIDVSNYKLDHIGYQCSSDNDYDNLKNEVNEFASLVSENIVGGRRVGIFKLDSPLKYNNWGIEAFEIIAPKESQSCPSALEHAELAVDSDFKTFIKKYSNIPFDTSKIDQPVFPMVTLKLSENTQVKFHLKPILEIVKSQ